MALTKSQTELLKNWLSNRQISVDEPLLKKIGLYHDLILVWSQRMNLVSKGDRTQIIENHFLDSLLPLKEIPFTGHLLDVGSGAGFPAIPIAMFRPNLSIDLVESVHKKTLFLQIVKKQLELDRVNIIENRLELLKPNRDYDIITIRALPKWEKLLKRIRPFLKPHGKIIYFDKRNSYKII